MALNFTTCPDPDLEARLRSKVPALDQMMAQVQKRLEIRFGGKSFPKLSLEADHPEESRLRLHCAINTYALPASEENRYLDGILGVAARYSLVDLDSGTHYFTSEVQLLSDFGKMPSPEQNARLMFGILNGLGRVRRELAEIRRAQIVEDNGRGGRGRGRGRRGRRR